MLVNFLENQGSQPPSNIKLHSWQIQLVALGDRTAIGGLAVATAFLQRMQDNDLKMKNETLFWIIKVVKGLILKIIYEDKSAQDIDNPDSYI
jgi:hypothetical protein